MALRPMTVGILWMSLSELIFVAAWCGIKALGRHLPLFEITFFRSIASVILIAPLVFLRQGSFRGKAVGTLLLRSLFGFLAMIASFYAMIHLQLGNASTLINTMPIFVAILAPLLLREPFSLKRLVLIVISFAGIGMLLKPDAGILEVAALLGLASAVSAALAMLCVRKLRTSDSPMIITFYFTGFSALASAPGAVATYAPPTATEWGLIAFVGITATIGQLLLVRAYRFAHAATIAPFAYVAVIGSFIAGVILFGEIPDLWSIAGAAIIIACGVGISLLAPAERESDDVIPPAGDKAIIHPCPHCT